MDKNWEKFYKKMLINSTYGFMGNELVSDVKKKIENLIKIEQREEKIKKLFE